MNRYFGLHTLEGEWHALLPRYLFLAERVKDMRVLDIGCGAGLGSSLLLELGARRVDAIDHRPAVIELARMKHAKAGLNLQVMLWEELDYDPESFDIILCLDPTSPVTDPNLLREVRRVLKPSGEYICAIERTTVRGLETLLPRYGYTHSAEQVGMGEGAVTVPQLGELARYFKRVFSIIQRPQYGFVFDYAPSEEGASLAEGPTDAHKHVDEQGQEAALTLESMPAGSTGTAGAERWIAVDKSFANSEAELAGIELWFCGDEQLHIPRLREVRLPYYSIVERLQKAKPVNSIGEHHALMDEILDHGEDGDLESKTREFTLEENTGVFAPLSALLDEEQTQVRQRPTLDEIRRAGEAKPPSASELNRAPLERLQTHQLDAYIQQLSSLHDRTQSDLARTIFEIKSAFEQREGALKSTITRLEQIIARQDDAARQQREDAQRIQSLEAELAQHQMTIQEASSPSETSDELLDELPKDALEAHALIDEPAQAEAIEPPKDDPAQTLDDEVQTSAPSTQVSEPEDEALEASADDEQDQEEAAPDDDDDQEQS